MRFTFNVTLAAACAAVLAAAGPAQAQAPADAMAEAVAAQELAPAAANPAVDVPAEGSSEISVAAVELGIPAHGVGDEAGATTVFDGTAPATQIGIQPTHDGVRALVQLDGASAPARHEFSLGGDVATLELADDGIVLGRNSRGDVVAWVQQPWAVDANGVAVPTRYEVQGTTLTQIVEHGSGQYAYPIVADPAVAPNCITFSINWLGHATVKNRCASYQRVKAVRRAMIDTTCRGMNAGSSWGFMTVAGIDRLERC